MTTPITTAFDTYVSRYPFLASLTLKASEEDETYKDMVDMKGADWSPIPNGVETHSIYGTGPMQRRGETTPFAYDSPGPAGTKKSYFSSYALALYFTEQLILNAQYGIIEKLASGLGNSFNMARNLEVAGLYDDFFTGTLYTGPDGKALGATDHTTYGANGVERANILATPAAFSYESVQALVKVMRDQKDERGYSKPAVRPGDPIQVIISSSPEFEAYRLFDAAAQLEPTTNKNAINVLKKYGFSLTPNLHMTNTQNWFLANPNEKMIRLVDKQALTPDSFTDPYNKGVQYDVRAMWVLHPEDWTGVYGSNG